MNQLWPTSLVVLAGYSMHVEAQAIVTVSCIILSFIGLLFILAVEFNSYVTSNDDSVPKRD